MLIDHFNLPVTDLERSLTFYTRVLAPLGRGPLARDGEAVGFGVDTWEFGIVKAEHTFTSMHVGFRANSRSAVDDFFKEAVASGAESNGSPGVRSQYDPDYYAAYVFDPDGHNVEAVCRS